MKKNLILSLIVMTSLMLMVVGSVSAGPTDYWFTQDGSGEAGLVSGTGLGHTGDYAVRLYIAENHVNDDDAKLRIPYTGTLGSLTTFSYWTKVMGTDGELHPYGSMNIDSAGDDAPEYVIVQWEVGSYPPTGVDTWVQTTWSDTTRIHVVDINTGLELTGFGQQDANTFGNLKLETGWIDYNVLQVKVAVGMWTHAYAIEGFVDDVNINGVIYDFEIPEITDITVTPEYPKTTDLVTICADIEATSEIESVELSCDSDYHPFTDRIMKDDGTGKYCTEVYFSTWQDNEKMSCEITATDEYDNSETGIVPQFTFDGLKPTTTDDSDDLWHNLEVTVMLTCEDGAGSGCYETYYCIDQTDTCNPTTEGNSVTVSAEGVNYVRFYSTDIAGNEEVVKSATNTVKIDTIAPEITNYVVTNPVFSPNGDGVKDTVIIDLEFSETVGYDIEIVDDGEIVVKSWTGTAKNPYEKPWDGTGNTGDGVYTIKITIEDEAENQIVNELKTITLDTTAPVTTDNAPANWQNSTVTVTLDCDDEDSGCYETYFCVYQEGDTCDPNEEYIESITISDEGINYVRYYSTDFAGNVEDFEISNAIKIDITVPEITDISENISVVVSGDAKICATIIDDRSNVVSAMLYYDSTEVPMGNVGDKYCYTIPTLEEDKEYWITAIDDAGNEETSLIYTIEVFDFIIELQEEWNLISIPVVPDNTTIGDVLEDADVSKVYAYDPLNPNADSDWLSFIDEEGSLKTMTAGYGYWVYTESATVIKGNGDLISEPNGMPTIPPSRNLVAGWNLIGHYGLTEEKEVYCSLFSLIDTTIGYPKWSALFGYDVDIDEFEALNVEGYTYPKQGYWIEMDVEDLYAPATTCWEFS